MDQIMNNKVVERAVLVRCICQLDSGVLVARNQDGFIDRSASLRMMRAQLEAHDQISEAYRNADWD